MSKDNFDSLDNLPTIGSNGSESKILAGRYRIIRKLGEGGMGLVYLAEDTELGDEKVAIKFIPPMLAGNVRAIKNLKKEAQTTRQLGHQNIVRLHDLHTDGHQKFLVMEYIKGKTLEQILDEKENEKVTFEELLPIVEQIAAGLDYAHKRKVLHRDLKPSNIMIAKDGTVKLLDFGIAREMKDSYTRVTGKGTSGTLPYMSPQQLMGEPSTVSMDIYSLGAVLYECLSGHPPFYTGDIREQIKSKVPPDLSGVDKNINNTIQSALAKSSDQRPKNASDLVKMLTGKKKPRKDMPDYAETVSPKKEKKHKVAMVKAFATVIILALLLAGVFAVDKKYDLIPKLRDFVAKTKDNLFGAGKIQKNAEIAAQKGDYDQAVKLLDKLIAKYPTNTEYTQRASAKKPEWEKENAIMVAQKGDYAQAIVLLDNLIAEYPNTEYAKWASTKKPEWEKENAIMVAQKGDYAQAIVLLDNLIAEYPNTEYAQWALAKKSKWQKAIEDEKRIRDLFYQAQTFKSENQLDKAFDCVAEILKIDSENEEAKKLQVELKLLIKKRETARVQEQSFQTYSKAGSEAENKRNWPEAKIAYAEALKIKPDDSGTQDKLATCQHNLYFEKADIDFEQGRLDDAISDYTMALSFKQVASTQTKLDAVKKAKQAQIDAEKYEKLIVQAQNKEETGDLRTALGYYEEALNYAGDESLRKETNEKINTLKARITEIEKRKKFNELLDYAKAKDNKKQCKNALEALKKALDLYPDDQEALALKDKITAYCSDKIIINSIGMELILIPAGKFTMGSPPSEERNSDEGPQREVKIDRFYIGVYEVTQEQYRTIMGSNPSRFSGNDLPVEQVSWNDAVEFCRKISQKEDKIYRLPTEAEWEYACRAGTATAFNNGQNGFKTVSQICWCSYDGMPGSARQTKPVGIYAQNKWGLYDMHGNVWEWCQDWYDENYYSQIPLVNPQGPSSGNTRVLRGGSWFDTPKDCRSARRYCLKADNSRDKVGFRVVCETD